MGEQKTRPLIADLMSNPMSGLDIENRSFEIIDSEVDHVDFSTNEWEIVRRIIHTTADPVIADFVRFSPDAIASGIKALQKTSRIYVDSNMIRSGISMPRLRGVSPTYTSDHVVCHVADRDVADNARTKGLPRSLYAVRKAIPLLDAGIAVFGNAPVALLELNRLIMETGIRPALVIAMPVGFVHVIESKEELMALDVPFIAIAGRRGGSPLAVSVIHALCGLAQKEDRVINMVDRNIKPIS